MDESVMDDRQRGLVPKYRAIKIDNPNLEAVDAREPIKIAGFPMEEVTDPFFLMLFSDPHARRAIKTYALSCAPEYPVLAKELMDKLKETQPESESDGRKET